MTLVLVKDNNIGLTIDYTAHTIKAIRCYRTYHFNAMLLQYILYIPDGIIAQMPFVS